MATGKNKAAPATKVSEALKFLTEKWKGSIDLVKASDLVTCDDLKRPTGLLDLDIALGGGFQGGRLVIVSGMSGLGKDYLLNLLIKKVQENYGDRAAVVIGSFGADHDPTFAQLCGVVFPRSEADIKRLEEEQGAPFDPDTRAAMTRTVGEIIIPQFGSNPEYLKNPAGYMAEFVIDCVRQGVFQLVVLNEVGSHVTKDLASKSMDVTGDKETANRAPADTARFFDHFMAKYCLAMKQSGREFLNETTVMFLSQIRMHFTRNASWSESVGGEHLRHVKSIEVKLSPGDEVEASGAVVGKKVKWKIIKGKHGIGDGAHGEYKFLNQLGVDLIENTVDAGVKHKVIEVSPPYVSWGGIRTKGFVSFRRELDKSDRVEELRRDIFKQLGLVFRVR